MLFMGDLVARPAEPSREPWLAIFAGPAAFDSPALPIGTMTVCFAVDDYPCFETSIRGAVFRFVRLQFSRAADRRHTYEM